MNKQMKQITAVLMVLAVVLIAGCTEEMSAEQIAANMMASQENIEDFSATVVRISQVDGENTTVRAKTVFKPPDKERTEYIEPAEVAGMVTLKNGSTVWMYDPAKNRVIKMTRPEKESFETDYTKPTKDLVERNDISYKGTGNIAGRSAYVIEVTPKDKVDRRFISRSHFWIDRETWMMIGMEIYDTNGNSIARVEYRDVTFNTGIPDSEFIFEVPEDAKVVEQSLGGMPEEMTLEEARANLSFELKTPSYLPDGYEFEVAVVSDKEHNRLLIEYRNESDRLHLSEEVSYDSDQPEFKMYEPEMVRINGARGKFVSTSVFGVNMNTLSWSVDGIDYLLSGTLAKEGLTRVAESIT